jgi:hypothetical protein
LTENQSPAYADPGTLTHSDAVDGAGIGVVHPVSFDCAEFGEFVYVDEQRATTV